MTLTESKLVRFIKERNAHLGQLDMLVEDIKCQQATRINAKGTIAQVRYLLKFQTPDEIRENVEHEMKILRRYNMKLQSKIQPEKNRKVK